MGLRRLAAVLAVILAFQTGLAAPRAQASPPSLPELMVAIALVGSCALLLGNASQKLKSDSELGAPAEGVGISDGLDPRSSLGLLGLGADSFMEDWEIPYRDEALRRVRLADRYIIFTVLQADHLRDRSEVQYLNLGVRLSGYGSWKDFATEGLTVSREYFYRAIEGIEEIGAPVEEAVVQDFVRVGDPAILGHFSSTMEYRFQAEAGLLVVRVESRANYNEIGAIRWNPPRIVGFENRGLEN